MDRYNEMEYRMGNVGYRQPGLELSSGVMLGNDKGANTLSPNSQS